MKKILIVEDTQVNLDAAKAFFSNISGYEFRYVTNRQDAYNFAPQSDAVITDRVLPFSEDAPLSFECSEDSVEMLMQSNGYYIFLLAKHTGKPAVMITGHGESLGIGTTEQELQMSKFDLLRDTVDFPSEESYDHLSDYARSVINLNFDSRFPKKNDPAAWNLAWRELLKQF